MPPTLQWAHYDLLTHRSSGSVVRALGPRAGGRGFDPRPCQTKDVIEMVPDTSLLSAQHIKTLSHWAPRVDRVCIARKNCQTRSKRGNKWMTRE